MTEPLVSPDAAEPRTPPTRRSLRTATTARGGRTRPLLRVAWLGPKTMRPWRSVLALTMVGGLVATVALPAYGAWQAVAPVSLTSQQMASDDVQSLIVASDVPDAQLTRNSYAATTPEEIAQMRAAEAAAAAAASARVASVPFDAGIAMSGSGAVRWPLSGPFTVTDRFGTRGGAHMGTDMVAAGGTPIFAALDGVVRISQDDYGAYGVTVVVESVLNGQRVSTVYPHMQTGSRMVASGATVAAGQVVGLVGSTGRSTGNHLHFEVYINGTAVDSLIWLQANAG